jgi:OmpA-OmpF porin, OOP family
MEEYTEMSFKNFRVLLSTSLLAGLFVLLIAPAVLGQTESTSMQREDARVRTISAGERVTIRGVVVRREADSFVMRDNDGADITVLLTDTTRVIERESNPFRSSRNYGVTNILRGLNLEARGRGDGSGALVADRVRFTESDLRVARSIDSRVNPVENRVGAVEENAQRLSGQLDELAAISNAARGGAAAAQQTADAAVSGVNATNERISALDDYETLQTSEINFRVNSAVLSPQARRQLDELAQRFFSARNFLMEVRGYTDTTGSVEHNRRLSARRAEAVVRYLAENHNIPLRRIITPFGYGEAQAVADNRTSEGRARNRRVEVRVLVNRGLAQPTPTMNVPTDNGTGGRPN